MFVDMRPSKGEVLKYVLTKKYQQLNNEVLLKSQYQNNISQKIM